MDRGTLVDHDGRPAVRFEREYAHPVERLWAAITNPDELAHWFPSRVRMQHRIGGTIEFLGDPNLPDSGHSGTILVWEPPHRLAYSWHDGELHFTLEPAGGGCVLTLTDVLEARDAAARNAAGWTVCLAELGKHLRRAGSRWPARRGRAVLAAALRGIRRRRDAVRGVHPRGGLSWPGPAQARRQAGVSARRNVSTAGYRAGHG